MCRAEKLRLLRFVMSDRCECVENKGECCMNIAVAQSGGPTCAINASLVGVFRESLKEPTIDAIFGSVNGAR